MLSALRRSSLGSVLVAACCDELHGLAPLAGAEIGGDHGRVVLHLGRRAVGNLAAAIEHDDVVGNIHHHAHVVLDQHHGDAALLVHVEHVARHVFFLVLVHAAHGLVEQQDLGLQRQRAAELHALAQAVGQRRRRLLAQVLQLQELDDLLARRAVADLLALRQAPVQHAAQHARAHAHVAAEHEVVEHGQAAEQRDVLERARDAQRRNRARALAGDVAAFQGDAPAVGPVEAGDHVEQRGLAGAVGADDREDAALGDVDRHAIDRDDAAEALGAPSTDICTAAAVICSALSATFMRAALAPPASTATPTAECRAKPARMDEPSQVPPPALRRLGCHSLVTGASRGGTRNVVQRQCATPCLPAYAEPQVRSAEIPDRSILVPN